RTVLRAVREALERTAEMARDLAGPPWHHAVALQPGHAELLDGGAELAGQRVEWKLAVLSHAEVDEVIRIVLPADVAPQIGIDGPHDDLVPIALVERLELGRQQPDRAPRDVFVRLESPGRGSRGNRERDEQRRCDHDRASHAGILRHLDNAT